MEQLFRAKYNQRHAPALILTPAVESASSLCNPPSGHAKVRCRRPQAGYSDKLGKLPERPDTDIILADLLGAAEVVWKTTLSNDKLLRPKFAATIAHSLYRFQDAPIPDSLLRQTDMAADVLLYQLKRSDQWIGRQYT